MELHTDYPIRKPTEKEINLIKYLADIASIILPADWAGELVVKNMQDGAMGSLNLYWKNDFQKKVATTCVAETTFKDKDNITVIASLYVDEQGIICELDIWKTDFTPLVCYPDFK